LKEYPGKFIIGHGTNDGNIEAIKTGSRVIVNGRRRNVLIIKMTNFPYEVALMAMFIFITLYLIINIIL